MLGNVCVCLCVCVAPGDSGGKMLSPANVGYDWHS